MSMRLVPQLKASASHVKTRQKQTVTRSKALKRRVTRDRGVLGLAVEVPTSTGQGAAAHANVHADGWQPAPQLVLRKKPRSGGKSLQHDLCRCISAVISTGEWCLQECVRKGPCNTADPPASYSQRLLMASKRTAQRNSVATEGKFGGESCDCCALCGF